MIKQSFKSHFSSTFYSSEVLTEKEKLLTTTMTQKRIQSFSTGRFCAKNALKLLSIVDFDLLPGRDSEPLWPEGIVGSISHSDKMAGAVVAMSKNIIGIGMDIETVGRIRRDIWEQIFTENEIQYLSLIDDQNASIFPTLFFSFKESYFKFQFPITGKYLNFTDMEVTLIGGEIKLNVIHSNANTNTSILNPQLKWCVENRNITTVCFAKTVSDLLNSSKNH